jgi:hypothetical protein
MINNKNLKLNNNNNYTNEKNKFYRIKSNIGGTALIHLSGFNNDYVEYTVNIKTDYGRWTLKKRYEDFYKLHNSIVSIIPEIKPYFPPKKYFFKNSENTTKERVKYFTKYLKYLLNKINIFKFEDIINFIYLERGMIGLFIKKYNMLKIGEENYIYSSLTQAFTRINKNPKLNQLNAISEEEILSCLQKDNYYNAILDFEKKRQVSFDWDEPSSMTPYLFVIREFLHNLSEKIENKADIIQVFENFLKSQEKWIKFSKKEITELFIGFDEDNEDNEEVFNRTITFGNNVNKNKESLFKWLDKKFDGDEDDDMEQSKTPGLFQQIGDFGNNVISAVGSLDLLDKLLDPEYNPDYEMYISIYKNMKIFEYKFMKLNDFIKKNIGGNKANVKALKLIHLIFNDKRLKKYEEEILPDEYVYKQYKNYSHNFSD